MKHKVPFLITRNNTLYQWTFVELKKKFKKKFEIICLSLDTIRSRRKRDDVSVKGTLMMMWVTGHLKFRKRQTIVVLYQDHLSLETLNKIDEENLFIKSQESIKKLYLQE